MEPFYEQDALTIFRGDCRELLPAMPEASVQCVVTSPPKLAERCMKAGSAEGDIVLDPFSGAGTTGLVAQHLGRKAILLELNPDYCAIAAKRCAQSPLLMAV